MTQDIPAPKASVVAPVDKSQKRWLWVRHNVEGNESETAKAVFFLTPRLFYLSLTTQGHIFKSELQTYSGQGPATCKSPSTVATLPLCNLL